MSLRATLVEPASINFAKKYTINITKDCFKKAFISEVNLKEFMDAYANFIEKVSESNDVLGARDYDMYSYSCGNDSYIYSFRLRHRQD